MPTPGERQCFGFDLYEFRETKYYWYRVTFTDGSVRDVAVPDEPYVSLWDIVDRDLVSSFEYLGFYGVGGEWVLIESNSPTCGYTPPEPPPEPPPPEPPPIVPCLINITAPASAAEGEAVNVSALIVNVSAYNFSYRTEILAGTVRIFFTSEVITSGSSKTYSASFTMPGSDVTILVWVERWASTYWAYDNAASKLIAVAGVVGPAEFRDLGATYKRT